MDVITVYRVLAVCVMSRLFNVCRWLERCHRSSLTTAEIRFSFARKIISLDKGKHRNASTFWNVSSFSVSKRSYPVLLLLFSFLMEEYFIFSFDVTEARCKRSLCFHSFFSRNTNVLQRCQTLLNAEFNATFIERSWLWHASEIDASIGSVSRNKDIFQK